MRKPLLMFLLVAMSTLTARAATEAWVEVRSEHFTVLSDSGERQGRKLASQFERMRSVFHTLFPNSTYDSGSAITVLAFKDKKGFQAVEPAAYLAKGQLNLAGLFMRSPEKNYVLLRLDTEGEHPFATVYHEYTHYMMAKNAEWMPLWMNEGLAEFYQNTDIEDKDVLLGQPSSDDIVFLRQQKMLPLTTLFKVDHESPYYHDEQKGSIFYAESWALVHYIMITDNAKNQHRLIDYSQYLIQNEDPVAAAQHAFGDLNQLQKALDNYVGQYSFNMFKMKTGVAADESAFRVRTVQVTEVNAVRADVLVYNQRTQEAQALLESVLRDDPKSAIAHETMGYLKFREQDIPSARKWYGEAVQLDSTSYLAQYYFGVMSLQSGDRDHDEAVESSLRTAIKLNPSFAPAYDTLASFYGSRHTKLDEAHVMTLHAVQLEPGNIRYRMNAASILASQQQFATAISVLQVAKRLAKNPAEEANVQGHIDQFQKIQAMVESGGKVQMQGDTTSVTMTRWGGAAIAQAQAEDLHYPEKATGPRHKAKGVLRGVRCSYPTVLTLTVEQAGKAVTLYSNNYFKVVFTLGNYSSDEDVHPCTAIEGMKANVEYDEVTDPSVAGQLVSIELNK